MDELIIEAQKRKIERGKWNKFRDKIDLSGKAMEHFSDEFRQIMDTLRIVDDSVRSIAMGEEGNDPGQTLKDLLRVAQASFKRREYMVAVSYLGRFHERVEAINAELAKLGGTVDSVHHKFLFEDVDPDQVKYLTETLAPKFKDKSKLESLLESITKSKKADVESHALVAEAGVVDWWKGLWDDRHRTLAGWEKRFPKYAREIKAQTSSMISRSQSLLDNLLTTLKQLDSFRATRKLEEYLQAAARWRERYRAYNTAFTSFYNSQIKRFIDYQDTQQKAEQSRNDKTEQKLEQAENGQQAENTAKNWPPKAEEAPAKASPAKPLALLGIKDPVPAWEDMPPSFHRLYAQFQFDTKKMKPWEKLTDADKRLYYNAIVGKMNEAIKRNKEKAFPLIKAPPASPLKPADIPASPIAEVPAKTPTSLFEHLPSAPVSIPGPAQTGEHPVVPFVPTVKAPSPKVAPHTMEPISPTLVSPGVQPPPPPSTPREPIIELSELPTSEPYTEVEPLRQIPSSSRGRRAHTEFLTELESKASEHPMVQAAFILDYAKSIEIEEPEQCNQLRTLASSILGK